MMDMHRLRRRVLENSAVTELTVASMPPMPIPVRMRQADSDSGLYAVVAPAMPAVISARHSKVAGRRPKRSALPPSNRLPMPMPISSIDNTTPSATRLTFHSAAITGAAKLMDSRS